jgi:hypothetical protein
MVDKFVRFVRVFRKAIFMFKMNDEHLVSGDIRHLRFDYFVFFFLQLTCHINQPLIM